METTQIQLSYNVFAFRILIYVYIFWRELWYILIIRSRYYFFLESFNLWRPLLMIALYHQTKTLISFWCRRRLNPRSLIQLSKILLVKLTRIHSQTDILKSYYIIILRFSIFTFFFKFKVILSLITWLFIVSLVGNLYL